MVQEDFRLTRETKVVIGYDDMIADMGVNKKLSPIAFVES